MNEEIDLYKDVDKIHSHEYYEPKAAVNDTSKVSLLIGNLTWWTSDYELEKFIRKCGVNDLYEENSTNGQSKGFALIHVCSESSAKILLDKLPDMEINGKKPAPCLATEENFKHFNQSSGSKSRERPEIKENGSSKNPSGPPPIIPPNVPMGISGMPIMMPPPITPPILPSGVPGSLPPGFPPTGFPPNVPPPGFPPSLATRPPISGMPPMPPGAFPPMPGMVPPPNFNPNFKGNPSNDPEDEETMKKNQQIQSSAIKRAVDDASNGDYSGAIETLCNAISTIKQSRVSKDERAKVMISSLQDCLHGIEEKSFGASSRSSRDSDRKKRDRRDRSRDRDRDRDRDRSDRDSKRRRSRSRERRRSDYEDRGRH